MATNDTHGIDAQARMSDPDWRHWGVTAHVTLSWYSGHPSSLVSEVREVPRFYVLALNDHQARCLAADVIQAINVVGHDADIDELTIIVEPYR